MALTSSTNGAKTGLSTLSFVNPPIEKWKETPPVKCKHELIKKQQNNKPYTKQYAINNKTINCI